MTFDNMVESMTMPDVYKELLKEPYAKIELMFVTKTQAKSWGAKIYDFFEKALGNTDDTKEELLLKVKNTIIPVGDIQKPDTSLRFLGDVLFDKVIKYTAGVSVIKDERARYEAFLPSMNDRLKTKLFHNLTFMTLLQYAIKNKIKSELDFINTRVVSNTAAVSDTITNGYSSTMGTVNDSLFEF
jgi:hypothetical protein